MRTPVVSVKPDPDVWAEAKRRAGGDVSRLRVQRDGSVIVLNQPRR